MCPNQSCFYFFANMMVNSEFRNLFLLGQTPKMSSPCTPPNAAPPMRAASMIPKLNSRSGFRVSVWVRHTCCSHHRPWATPVVPNHLMYRRYAILDALEMGTHIGKGTIPNAVRSHSLTRSSLRARYIGLYNCALVTG